jgi:teichuronic acid biosynthesis glycosyltransferase TuaG
MKKNQFISIIIPTYNSIGFIKKTVKSVLDQTYRNFEIIFVDDCSEDGTYQYLKNIQKTHKIKIKILRTKKNSGTPSTTRNLGIKSAKGELLCLVDSDDVWEKNKLELQLNDYTNKNTIYSTAARYFDSKNSKSGFLINFIRKKIQKFIVKKINNKGFQWLYIYNPIIISSVLAHKSVFKNHLFDDDANVREDLDIWIRLRKNNFKFYFNKNISINIFRRESSLSSNFKKELVTLIRSLSNVYLKMNTFSKLNYFLIGILIKFFLTFVKINRRFFLLIFKRFSIFIVIIYFIVFYTPLFWYLGKPLLHYDNEKVFKDYKNVVVFSGHGKTSNYDMTYLYRYKDILKISTITDEIENIFILGKLQEIPEQKIIEKMLISDGFDLKKIRVIYEEFSSTHKNIHIISNILKKEKINKITLITTPYHTKKAKLLWSKNIEVDVKILKGIDWPSRNNFFEYSKNKKIILYEYASIIYNKFLNKI